MIGLSAKLSSTYSSPGGSQNTPQIASGMELDADPSDWDQVRATSAPQSDPVWAMGMGMSGAVSGLEQCLLNFLVFLHRGIFCFCNMFCNATSFVCVCVCVCVYAAVVFGLRCAEQQMRLTTHFMQDDPHILIAGIR